MVSEFQKTNPNIIYQLVTDPGLHEGRHAGLKTALYEIICYLDDDVEVQPKWLQSVISCFEDDGASLVGGKVLPNFMANPPDWILEQWEKEKIIPELSVIDFGNEKTEFPPKYVFGCNFSVLKSAVVAAGGFHPDGMPNMKKYFRGDGETHISEYIETNNLKCIYHPDAAVLHQVSEGRLSKDYYVFRSFKEGISMSYVFVREHRISLFSLARKFYSFLRLRIKNRNSNSLKELQRLAFLKGYLLHQVNCLMNRKLLRWTRKESYLTND